MKQDNGVKMIAVGQLCGCHSVHSTVNNPSTVQLFNHSNRKRASRIIRGGGEVTFDRHLTGWVRSAHTAPYRKFGFTLAEVLITLGIIGVVAALTMPVLIQKYQEHVTVNKVKKIYSTISQSVLMSVSYNGYPNEWNVSNAKTHNSAVELSDYIKPYIKYIKDCGTASSCFNYPDGQNFLNGFHSDSALDSPDYRYSLILADGTYLAFEGTDGGADYCKGNVAWLSDNYCGTIYFDINGNKLPNTFGKDMFILYLTSKGIETPSPNPAYCNKTHHGWGCSGFILYNGHMRYPDS